MKEHEDAEEVLMPKEALVPEKQGGLIGKGLIRCSDCGYCHGYRPVRNTRTEFRCRHPDREHIREYYRAHKIYRSEGFIGFSEAYSTDVPVKTSPRWCPKKEGG